MEEDIKILEELLDKKLIDYYNSDDYEAAVVLSCYEITSIENLIKGYKIEKLKNVLDEQSLKEALENYIPKSKIQKIKEKNEKKIDEMRPYRHQGPFDFGVLNGIDECCRILLENK